MRDFRKFGFPLLLALSQSVSVFNKTRGRIKFNCIFTKKTTKYFCIMLLTKYHIASDKPIRLEMQLILS